MRERSSTETSGVGGSGHVRLDIRPIVSASKHAGLVTIALSGPAQMTTAEARAVAQQLLDAAQVADEDAAIFTRALRRTGDMTEARAVLNQHRLARGEKL